jgi:hypothetical protein
MAGAREGGAEIGSRHQVVRDLIEVGPIFHNCARDVTRLVELQGMTQNPLGRRRVLAPRNAWNR